MIAEFERLLDDGGEDRAFLYTSERLVFLVEADDLDLVEISGLFDSAQDRRAVVAPEADHASDVSVFNERVSGVGFGTCAVGIVGANVDDLDL